MPEKSNPVKPVAASPDGGRASYVIFELARAHRGCAAAVLRGMNLHPGQELVLMHLFDRDGQTQSELVAGLGLDHSTVSKALRRMADTGFLVRTPAEHDRRVSVVHLTDKGSAMREPIAAMWRTLEVATARNLTAQQKNDFIDTAHAIVDSFMTCSPTTGSTVHLRESTGEQGCRDRAR